MKVMTIALVVAGLLIASCGDPVDWSPRYEQALNEEWAARTPEQVAATCALLPRAIDEDPRAFFEAERSGKNLFEDLMSDLGIRPDEDQVERAIGMAMEHAQLRCL